MDAIPTFEEFLAAPLEEVQKVAPVSMGYGVGATRRAAVLEGIEPWSDEFMVWARKRVLSCQELIFRHGVKYIFTPLITPNNVKESHRHRDQLFRQVEPVVAGPESIEHYQRLGIRVRLLGGEQAPEIKATAEKLRAMTDPNSQQTLYWLAVLDATEPWTQLLSAVKQTQASTQAEAIRAVYGEDIPPITLYLNHGKPEFSFNTIPPLLVGQTQCYWHQRPGSLLDETMLRVIFYDYAYLRATWRADKLERAQAALRYPQAWQKASILGLGVRLGPFWYPAPVPAVADMQQ